MREYLPLGGTDAETSALSESLLARQRSPRTPGGGRPGRKPGAGGGGLGQQLYAGRAGGEDVERGGGEAATPATPGAGLEARRWAGRRLSTLWARVSANARQCVPGPSSAQQLVPPMPPALQAGGAAGADRDDGPPLAHPPPPAALSLSCGAAAGSPRGRLRPPGPLLHPCTPQQPRLSAARA